MKLKNVVGIGWIRFELVGGRSNQSEMKEEPQRNEVKENKTRRRTSEQVEAFLEREICAQSRLTTKICFFLVVAVASSTTFSLVHFRRCFCCLLSSFVYSRLCILQCRFFGWSTRSSYRLDPIRLDATRTKCDTCDGVSLENVISRA